MALEDHLRAESGGNGAKLTRLRKRIVFERFLVRLEAVAAGRWLLKGAFALDLRLGDRARTTMDIDIEWRADVDEALDALIDAAQRNADDYFVYEIERTSDPQDRFGGAARFNVRVELAGRAFERFVLDVGFRSKTAVAAARVALREDLAFAGVASAEIGAVHVESQMAEKLHAYSRIFAGGRVSSRTKDLVDFVLIAESLPVDAARLRAAIDEVFSERNTHAKPRRLPRPPADWLLPYRALADAVGVSPSMEAGHTLAATVIDPILQDSVSKARWDPRRASWVVTKDRSGDPGR